MAESRLRQGVHGSGGEYTLATYRSYLDTYLGAYPSWRRLTAASSWPV